MHMEKFDRPMRSVNCHDNVQRPGNKNNKSETRSQEKLTRTEKQEDRDSESEAMKLELGIGMRKKQGIRKQELKVGNRN